MDRHRNGPLGDRSLPQSLIRLQHGGPPKKPTSPKHLRGRAIYPKAPPPQTWTVTETDRSEIGPYLGASSGYSTVVLQKKQPLPSISEVGRFLRKRRVRRHGPSQKRTARRSVGTRGPLGDWSLPRSLVGTHGLLGDRSLPGRSSGGLRRAKKLSVTVGKPMKPAGLKTTENSEEPRMNGFGAH